ncbi:MAG: hypothetical protein J6X70_05265 [Muribaculaceae bacterium]|nr:hypothetical protein [Muribaculaceae bacterium]
MSFFSSFCEDWEVCDFSSPSVVVVSGLGSVVVMVVVSSSVVVTVVVSGCVVVSCFVSIVETVDSGFVVVSV